MRDLTRDEETKFSLAPVSTRAEQNRSPSWTCMWGIDFASWNAVSVPLVASTCVTGAWSARGRLLGLIVDCFFWGLVEERCGGLRAFSERLLYEDSFRVRSHFVAALTSSSAEAK